MMHDAALARFRSTTRPAVWYDVVLNPKTGELRCEGCPGFARWRRCWHIQVIGDRWRRQRAAKAAVNGTE